MPAKTRSVGGRALLSVALLLGFYVLAGGVLVGLYLLNAAVLTTTGRVYSTLVVFSVLTAVAVVRGVLSVLRRSDEVADGVAVTRAQEPRLWNLVDQVARDMGTRPPDDLRVVGEVNAYVSESGGLLGLRRGRRRMAVGLGLLQVLEADGLRAVLAHELGHYAGGDTRLGPLNYRAGVSMGRTIDHLGPDTLLGKVFVAYAQLYWRVSLAVRRRQELAADRAAVRVGGQSAHIHALENISAAGPAFAFFIDRYVAAVWRAGQRPDNLFEGFRSLWADGDRQAELATVIEDARTAEPHPLDSHPSLAQRLATARSLADAGGARDRTPARTVLTDPDALERRLSRELSERALGRPLEEGVSWAGVGDAVYRPELLARARLVLDEVAVVDGGARPATIGRLLAVLESDALLALAIRLGGDLAHVAVPARAEHQAKVLRAGVFAVVGAALVDAAGARYELSWSGSLQVRGRAGRPLDVDAWIEAAVDDEQVTSLRAGLAEEGVASTWAPVHVPAPEPTDAGPGLAGIVPDARYLGKAADVLVLADALVVVRARSTGWERLSGSLAASAGMSRGRSTQARLARVLRRPLDDILAEDPRNRRLPLGDIANVRLGRRATGWRLDLQLVDGERVQLSSTNQSPHRTEVAAVLAGVLGERLAA